MKTIFKFFPVLAIICFGRCARPQQDRVANRLDYEKYLHRPVNTDLEKLVLEMDFWKNKLAAVPESATYRAKLAGLYSSRFLLTGGIEDVVTSDSLYHKIQGGTSERNASILRALAANCITQHKFIEAREYVQQALALGEDKASSLLMRIDVDMELGNYPAARYTLKRMTGNTFFPYLIRLAKIQDHEGHLDSAILTMENAREKVKDKPGAWIWAESNLADMYGHAGRIKDSYISFLRVLEKNPDYDYALKGIAWIAFSNDHNYEEAKRIVHSIERRKATPDMHLLLAQIAAAENDNVEREGQLSVFVRSATAPRYGDMYNKYIALLQSEDLSDPNKAIVIARREIHNRPTPQSFDLLAWGNLRAGNVKAALAIARQHVENKTFEPDAYYHLAMIYKANGMREEAIGYFQKAALSSFELGPATTAKIDQEILN